MAGWNAHRTLRGIPVQPDVSFTVVCDSRAADQATPFPIPSFDHLIAGINLTLAPACGIASHCRRPPSSIDRIATP